MNSSQLTDIRRLQSVICSLQKQTVNSNYYTNNNDIIPNGDLLYDIGSSNDRFNSLYLGYGTLYMGDPTKTSIAVNYCNVLYCKPGLAAPYIEFANSNYPTDTESIQSGIHVYYNVGCNDLWKRYPDGCNAPFGTSRGQTGPQGPTWQFSNDLLPQLPGLNIGAALSNVNNLFLSNAVILNGASITSLSGHLYYQGIQLATSQDFTNGVSTISSIVSYGLSSIAQQPNQGVSSLSSIVSYGLSSLGGLAGPGISSLSSIVSYGLSSLQTYGTSSLSSIVSYGLSSIAQQPNQGISSLSSITSYGLSTVAAQPSPGVSSLSSITSYGLSSILNSNTQQPILGGVLRVDQIYGNDAAASLLANRYQLSFKTISAAMSNAYSGECIYVLPGTYNEKIVFSNNISLRGINAAAVKIQQVGCTGPTTLITLATNNRLEDVTLNVSSSNSNATPLIGIFMSNVADPITATKMRGIVINMDNSAMTCNVPTNVYGIYTTGNSALTTISSDDLQRSTVDVTSSGPGTKRGIYNDGSNGFRLRDVNIFCKDNPAYTGTSNGTYYGIETNNINALIVAKSSTSYAYAAVAGNNSADISQTLGTIGLAGTDLPNRNANGKGFTNSTAQPAIGFSISGQPSTGLGHNGTYLIPGTLPTGTPDIDTYYGIRCLTISIIDQFAFQCRTIANSGTSVAAVLYKNSNVQSNFTLILSNGGPTYISTSNVSLTITKNDTYAVYLSNVGGSTFANNDITYPLVTVSFY